MNLDRNRYKRDTKTRISFFRNNLFVQDENDKEI